MSGRKYHAENVQRDIDTVEAALVKIDAILTEEGDPGIQDYLDEIDAVVQRYK